MTGTMRHTPATVRRTLPGPSRRGGWMLSVKGSSVVVGCPSLFSAGLWKSCRSERFG